MTQTKLELTNEIIKQISTLNNLYCLDLIKRAIEAEMAIRSVCLDDEESSGDLL